MHPTVPPASAPQAPGRATDPSSSAASGPPSAVAAAKPPGGPPLAPAEPAARRLEALAARVVQCEACPGLRAYCQEVARTKRRAFADWEYWGRPLPGFGDPQARLLVVGLAPAAHGGNRTGRMFTGDSSADWLLRAMYRAGFANQPTSTHRGDGLRLLGAYITAACRCAPPDNRPTPAELAACRPFLVEELGILWPSLRAVVVLGQIALAAYLRALADLGRAPAGPRPAFAHGATYRFGPGHPALIVSYHPSRQNTQTGRLSEAMLDQVFATARALCDGAEA